MENNKKKLFFPLQTKIYIKRIMDQLSTETTNQPIGKTWKTATQTQTQTSKYKPEIC